MMDKDKRPGFWRTGLTLLPAVGLSLVPRFT